MYPLCLGLLRVLPYVCMHISLSWTTNQLSSFPSSLRRHNELNSLMFASGKTVCFSVDGMSQWRTF